MARKLTLFLCDSPFQHESVDHAVELARAALRKGHEVSVYLMMDGVYGPISSQKGEPFKMPSVSERFAELIEEGLKISSCRVCMELRGVLAESLPEGVDVGGIFDLSEMIAESDVVVNLVGGS
ncbi:MAG: DsrE family protein [Candidatus Bathyarchaeota archaeon]|nr:MAG: DsrE family protein [Candidatus Bathyarchaeota archaeon]